MSNIKHMRARVHTAHGAKQEKPVEKPVEVKETLVAKVKKAIKKVLKKKK